MTKAEEQNLSSMSMTDLFRQEVASQTALLTDALLALEHQPADKKRLETLMRAAHSIKGAARIMGLDLAVKVAHELEDNFVAAQQGKITVTAAQTDILLEGVDFLLKISKCPDSDIAGGASALQPEAENILKHLSGVKSAAPPSATQAPPEAAMPRRETEPPPLSSPTLVVNQPGQTAPQPADALKAKEQDSAAQKPELQAQTVRITAEHLNRMLGMVDESIVQMHWLEPFIRRLSALKKKQSGLDHKLENLRLMLEEKPDATRIKERVNEICLEAKDCLATAVSHLGDIDDFSRRTEELNDRLYREALASRLRPFGDCAQGFPRMVRDLARRLEKNVRFELAGQDTKVDREILDKLEAPLAHLLRNAVDHGIENPEQRAGNGKQKEGLITLKAYHQAGRLHITVSDDGAGIDLERIRQKIIAKDLNSKEVTERLSEQEILNFLFLPGFSTSSEVTEISGRGVGLDIVLNLAQELGGSVRVENRRPNGTVFHLQLPITLSVIRALLVEIANEPFVFPLARVAHLVTVDSAQTVTLEGKRYLHYNGKNIGLISASEALELKSGTVKNSRWPVVIISDQDNHYGLIVDRFVGELLVVVRPLDARLGKVQDVGSVTLLNDGTPALILDVDDLLRSVDRILAGGGLKTIAQAGEVKSNKNRRRVLVADDSITVRELERKLLQSRGYQVDVTVDGMEAWNNLRAFQYDLLVSDVDMPRLNGIDLVRRIRQDPRLSALPIIIISYKDREEDRLRGLEAGANYYLTKGSFQDDTFLKAVVDMIGEAK
ncbi:MAG: hybrid sensor histidine kinase/response regulator [Kiritimatiellia bacterium]|nr:hybrid sensor histidine kinase/response regulator [Kiritimatiellia bacterium]